MSRFRILVPCAVVGCLAAGCAQQAQPTGMYQPYPQTYQQGYQYNPYRGYGQGPLSDVNRQLLAIEQALRQAQSAANMGRYGNPYR